MMTAVKGSFAATLLWNQRGVSERFVPIKTPGLDKSQSLLSSSFQHRSKTHPVLHQVTKIVTVALVFFTACVPLGILKPAWGSKVECLQFGDTETELVLPVPSFTQFSEVESFFFSDSCHSTLSHEELIPYLGGDRLFQLMYWGRQGMGSDFPGPFNATLNATLFPKTRETLLLQDLFTQSLTPFFSSSLRCLPIFVATNCLDPTLCNNCTVFTPTERCFPLDTEKQLGFTCNITETPGHLVFYCRELQSNEFYEPVIAYDSRSHPIPVATQISAEKLSTVCGYHTWTEEHILSLFSPTSTQYSLDVPLSSDPRSLLDPEGDLLITYSLSDLVSLTDSIREILTQTPPSPRDFLYRDLYAKARYIYNERPFKQEADPCDHFSTCRFFPSLIPPLGQTRSSSSSPSMTSIPTPPTPSLKPSLTQTLSSSASQPLSSTASQTMLAHTFTLSPFVADASSETAFGCLEWLDYFGVEVGPCPPLPGNISDILNAPCPIWGNTSANSLRVVDTHLLALIPRLFNHSNFTMNVLGTAVKAPLKGNHTQIDTAGSWASALGQWGPVPAPDSHWVLMTKRIVPGSTSQTYTQQVQTVANLAQKAGASYVLPNLLDAVTGVLIEKVRSGATLYASTLPAPWSRVPEQTSGVRLVFGVFSASGLFVSYGSGGNGADADVGVSALRKF